MTTKVRTDRPKYGVAIGYFCDCKARSVIIEKITQIAKSVGGISEEWDGDGPIVGFGSCFEVREARTLHEAMLFFKAVKKYAESCVIIDYSVPYEGDPDNDRGIVQTYTSRVWRKFDGINESAVTKHKNDNVSNTCL